MKQMKILVKDGYVSYKRQLFKAGQSADLDEAAARRFVALGVAVLLDNAANTPAAPKVEPETAEQQEGTAADLPAVDPAASVKRSRKKKKTNERV